MDVGFDQPEVSVCRRDFDVSWIDGFSQEQGAVAPVLDDSLSKP